MSWYKLTARLSHAIFKFLKNLTNFLDALFSGFWLGVMGKKSLEFSDELYYNQTKSYRSDKYNESGLFKWEKPLIERYFSKVKTILLFAAGGGREVLALSRMGYEIDAYECNPTLIEYGNLLLRKNIVDASIQYLPRNNVPEKVKQYDGIIIGWGAYSHMEGKSQRIAFLNSLHPFLKGDARLMISFIYVTQRNRKDRIIKNVSDFFRIFRRKFKTEEGDRLEPDFIHYFTEEEITNELIQARFKVLEYSSDEYGCVIASI